MVIWKGIFALSTLDYLLLLANIVNVLSKINTNFEITFMWLMNYKWIECIKVVMKWNLDQRHSINESSLNKINILFISSIVTNASKYLYQLYLIRQLFLPVKHRIISKNKWIKITFHIINPEKNVNFWNANVKLCIEM